MKDERPGVWIGHVRMTVRDPVAALDYYVALGMRPVHSTTEVGIVELRGGTHLILEPGSPEPGDAPFDLMVEDLDATHARLRDSGFDASEIIRGEIHDVFVLEDEDRQRIVVYSSHVVGPV